jgi:N-acetylmuramoyl-L-alanine amidase
MIILLDNGHGENTPGKRSPKWPDGSQLFEYEFNRDIVSRIVRGLAAAGIEHKILVTEYTDITLPERVRRANVIYSSRKDCLLVSVHGNASGTGQASGWEIFTSVGKTKSDEYATVFFLEAEKLLAGKFKLRADHSDGDPDKEEHLYILKHTNCSAVLTENLFFDNETDCRFMMSNAGRETIAGIHVNAILKIAGK